MQRTIIGQDKLLDRIDLLGLDDTPHTLLINGLCDGAGEHLVANYIAEHLGLPVDDITDKLSAELIESIYLKPEPIVYIIDTVNLSVKDQNVILKFIEEPLKNAYVILLCDNIYDLIPTVLNRCIIWTLDSYRIDTLAKFLPEMASGEIINIAHTPGQVIEFSKYDVAEMLKRALYIIENMHRASFNNMLKLINDVSFKDSDSEKFNIGVWVKIIQYTVTGKLESSSSIEESYKLTNALKLTIDLSNNIKRTGIDKQSLYYQYLINLWKILRNGEQ